MIRGGLNHTPLNRFQPHKDKEIKKLVQSKKGNEGQKGGKPAVPDFIRSTGSVKGKRLFPVRSRVGVGKRF